MKCCLLSEKQKLQTCDYPWVLSFVEFVGFVNVFLICFWVLGFLFLFMTVSFTLLRLVCLVYSFCLSGISLTLKLSAFSLC